MRKKLVLHRVGRQVKNQHDHENKLQMELEQINDSWKRVEFEELFLHKITTEEIKQHVKALEFKYKSVIPYYYVTQFLDYFYLKRRNDKILYWMISRHAHEETTLFNWLLLKPRNDVEFFAKAKAILRDYKQAIAALKSQFIFVLGEIEAAPPQLNKVLYNGARLFNEGQKRFKSGGFEPVTLEKESTNCVVVS